MNKNAISVTMKKQFPTGWDNVIVIQRKSKRKKLKKLNTIKLIPFELNSYQGLNTFCDFFPFLSHLYIELVQTQSNWIL